MPSHITDDILLVGTGRMGAAYANVLRTMSRKIVVIGRGRQSASQFEKETGIQPITGGFEQWLVHTERVPDTAIVALPVEELATAALLLLRYGVRRILIEKPGGINESELQAVRNDAQARNADVYVGYNRRFYASTHKALEFIKEDGGVSSFHFDFSEWSHVIAKSDKAPAVKENWFLANSTHVVDLAFFVGGIPRQMNVYTAGGLAWHPAASVFCGAGCTDKGALFSYHADWESPGRWGIELMTRKRRLMLRPLEQLQVQHIGSTLVEQASLEDHLDLMYKPGLYRQTEAFLENSNHASLVTIEQQCDRWKRFYSPIVNASSD
ncbi:Gfo/Idh/MocA family oxidoreductase [Paenibacillus sp. Soil522]|uniref:Gfo/Idh/MocA family oxidoreductase n=1 Tax=Paenibacillus sp. Soil522 TaxID=1736388 RepID=UPI00070185D9|nr:Gfo/Idh/MocA family oxidoreductase [Paenibacillus sp. Soil522]KRE46299.1 myo-inositol 2-dehydrogenase [Paenibacillus sp. Soil522]